jgi:hypothetical protein
MKKSAILFALLAAGLLASVQTACAQGGPNAIDIYFFWSSGCPHCAKERVFLDKLERTYSDYVFVHEYEVSLNAANAELFMRVGRSLGADVSGVPLAVLGNKAFIGFLNEETTGEEIKRAALQCMETYCADAVGSILGVPPRPDYTKRGPEINEGAASPQRDGLLQIPENAEQADTGAGDERGERKNENGYLSKSVKEHPVPETVPVPFLGNMKIKNLSLPAITVVMGALDGFNPCAMWVLLFLISLLIGMENRRRMWALGMTFIAASAFVYFLFMAAWLNALLFLGLVPWVRTGIAALALAAGGYQLHSYCTKPESGCSVMGEERRKRMFARIRGIISQKAFPLALVGIVGLAFAVNLIELLCSAGLPVIYTQILAMTNLPMWQYYGYLILYILIFMLDDLFVFIIAMKTLQMVGITTKYARLNHLIGGILMIIIGLLLFLKPEWLMFG